MDMVKRLKDQEGESVRQEINGHGKAKNEGRTARSHMKKNYK